MVELAGFPNADEFYPAWTEEQEQQYAQQKAQQPEQDPNMLMVQGNLEIEKQKLQLDAQKAQLEHERKVAEMNMKWALEQAKIEAQYGIKLSEAELKADVGMAQAIVDAEQKNNAAKAAAAAQPQGGPTNGPQPQPGGASAPGGGGAWSTPRRCDGRGFRQRPLRGHRGVGGGGGQGPARNVLGEGRRTSRSTAPT
jgi:hypothetical protein